MNTMRKEDAKSDYIDANVKTPPAQFSITIYDLKNHFIAYQELFEKPVKFIVGEWKSLFVTMQDGQVFR